ncbi:MAG: hypothetical protein KGZ81_08460 [Flavobacteriales bacterium]|nr:hypothetical protein [Flavobacteriales bacterium]
MKKDIKYFIITIFALSILYFVLKVNADFHYKKYGLLSIFYTTNYSVLSKDKSVKFIYYVNVRKIIGENRIGNQKIKLNTYYKMIYSSKNPKKVKGFFDNEITDTIVIRKAGFNFNDL